MVLGTLISHPELLGRDTLYELRSIVARYPYFQAARLLMLRNLYLLHDPDFGAELRRSVLYVSDRRALCRLIEGYTDRVVTSEPEILEEQPSVDRTMSLIDAFLDTLPEDHKGADTLLAVETVGDYATMFLTGGDTATDDVLEGLSLSALAADLIVSPQPADELSTAVASVQAPAPSTLTDEALVQGVTEEVAQADEEILDESYFTETLAKIYIKQRKYSRALEIIKSLYLQFPEKNTYFADQIRFLEKLIINNNLK